MVRTAIKTVMAPRRHGRAARRNWRLRAERFTRSPFWKLLTAARRLSFEHNQTAVKFAQRPRARDGDLRLIAGQLCPDEEI